MNYRVEKRMFGLSMIVVYDCPSCGEGLESTQDEFGQTHPCPVCHKEFIVPVPDPVSKSVEKLTQGNRWSAENLLTVIVGVFLIVFAGVVTHVSLRDEQNNSPRGLPVNRLLETSEASRHPQEQIFQPTTKDKYDVLPSGTVYIAPNSPLRRKRWETSGTQRPAALPYYGSRRYDYNYRPSVGNHYVRGYFRKDGTYVSGHRRTNRDDSFWNNWSSRGNTNPYTGRIGTKTPPYGYNNSGRTFRPSF